MNNDMNTGNGRSLLLLGALAALATNRDARSRLLEGSRNALEGAHQVLDETVKPALGTAASQAQDLAQQAAHRGGNVLDTLREETPVRAQTLLHSALDTATHLAGAVQERASQLAEGADEATSEPREQAKDALKAAAKELGHSLQGARESGRGLLAGVQASVHKVRNDNGDEVAAGRRRAERRLEKARRDAERELRRSGKTWKAAKLDREINKQLAPLHKEIKRELAQLDKQAMKRYRAESRRGGLGGLGTLVLVGTGVVVLARVPTVRTSILRAVEGMNPEAAQSLRRASRTARDLIGSAWLESIEEPKQTPAPGTAAKTQAGTTGGTWGASVEPGSPSAARTQAEQAQGVPAPGATSQEKAQQGEGGKKTNPN
ncbi:alginate biosynthesis protein AlgP [Deinococcus navajonensis]|uniref:Alginate biosynthesis protein AlgP n=1 Tax=Deinococcus navajonensis TaxID=309884 RepID=A0ABV8XLB4_9DEIO